jgi:hypothetical protein
MESIMGLTNALPSAGCLCKIAFEEYNLDNGMLFLHDPSAPVVITSVMYHVGSKMKIQRQVCPLFRTLLFEGTENIKEVNGLKL